MKVAAISGSPHGRGGATQVVLDAFLEGCREGNCQVEIVQLAEKNLGLCKACHACWTTSPGKCVLEDDLASILRAMENADLIVLASPLHFLQVSGNLKVFIDRLTSTGGNPHSERSKPEGAPPRLAAVMSCGFPKPEQFRATSLWMEDLSALLSRQLFLEAYAAGAGRLPRGGGKPDAEVGAWLEILGEAGRVAARGENLGVVAREKLKNGPRSEG